MGGADSSEFVRSEVPPADAEEVPTDRPPVFTNPNTPVRFEGGSLAEALLATRGVDLDPVVMPQVRSMLDDLDRLGARGMLDAGLLVAPDAVVDRRTLESLLVQLPDSAAQPQMTEDGRYLTRSGVDVSASVAYLTEQYGLDWRDAVVRMEQQVTYNALSGWAVSEFGEKADFGGMWIDQNDGGRLVVAGTSTEFGDAGRLALLGHPLVRFDTVTHSLGELMAARVELSERLDAAGQGAALVQLNVETNSLEVDFDSEAGGGEEEIEQVIDVFVRGGGPPVALVDQKTSSTTAACPDSSCPNPIGGMQIRGDDLTRSLATAQRGSSLLALLAGPQAQDGSRQRPTVRASASTHSSTTWRPGRL